MTDVKKIPSVALLQDNVSHFFDRFFEKYSTEMKCGQGCSRCCVSGLSIFPSEAQVVLNWFQTLDAETKGRLKNVWMQTSQSTELVATKKCCFLVDDLCSIYAARPTICRSQGLPMKVNTMSSEEDRESVDFELSLCELNFVDDSRLPPPGEWLDLERVNILLSIAEKNKNDFRLSEAILDSIHQSTGRIDLVSLRELLLHS